MTHDDAQREMSVERYLLGELQADARDDFEEHLFDCALCTADLQLGADFTEGLRAGGPAMRPQLVAKNTTRAAPASAWGERLSSWAASVLQPWIAAPALAACLAVICVQGLVIQPRLHRQLAEAETPSVINELIIKGTTRSLGMSEVSAHPGGGFLLSLDVPAESRFRAYRCTLVSPLGKPVWHTYLSPAQVTDTVVIHVPVSSTASGMNVLKVEGILQGDNGPAVSLLQRSFTLKIGD